MACRVVEHAPDFARLGSLYPRGESCELRVRILRLVHARRTVPAKVGEARRATRDFRTVNVNAGILEANVGGALGAVTAGVVVANGATLPVSF